MTNIGYTDLQFRQNIPAGNIQRINGQNYSQTNVPQSLGSDKFVLQNQAGKLIARNEDIRKLTKQSKPENKTKKYITTALLTLGTITGLAVLGNRSSNYMANLGHKVDDILLKQNWYKSFEKGVSNTKNKVKNFFFNNKNKLVKDSANDIAETLSKRRSGPTVDLARGYGQGFTTIFALTPVDVLRTSLTKIEKSKPGEALKSLEKLVGKENAKKFSEQILGDGKIKDNKAFCDELTNAIAKNFGLKTTNGNIDKKELLKLFQDLEKGKVKGVDFKEFTNIKMDQGGFIGSWWPVNFANSIGEKIAKSFGKTWKGFGKGNLGDSLTKYNAVNGTLAQTKAGAIVQQLLTVPTESISNFVNDKSGMGVLLSLTIASLYSNVQDAPNDKKVATLADDYIGTIGSIAITTPLAFGATYGLASMSNLEAKNWFTKMLKGVGKFFDYGHNRIGKNGEIINKMPKSKVLASLKRFSGHALRFALIMFVFQSMFDKPIRNTIHKVFGKPYDKTEEEEKQKGINSMQQNNYMPQTSDINYAENEFTTQVKHNPQTMEFLHTARPNIKLR